jgi:response regulator NasT
MIRLEAYQSAEVSKGALSVLIADDDMSFLHALGLLIKSSGHRVVATAHNGRDAITLALEHKPDVIIIDVDMPEVDGISAAIKIREELSVPIIFSTGHIEESTLDRTSQVDTQAYLVKPYSAGQLKSSLRHAVNHYRRVLENEIQLEELNTEIASINTVNLAVGHLMERFGIPRKEALEKIETAARVRDCPVAEAAAAISTTLARKVDAG